MANTVSIAQRFLGQILFDTEKDVLTKPVYGSPGEVFNTSVFLLSDAFRRVMTAVAHTPGYGVVGQQDNPALQQLSDVTYADLDDDKRAAVDSRGRALERMLRDAPARAILTGLVEAYVELEALQDAEAAKNADGDAGNQ